tara:strand:+ start:717 stop:1769 length:1053 start_codon:yes stop_codon:yes gene_type:complete
MEKLRWTNSEIRKLFRMGERYKSVQTLYNAEERGEIPKAEREPRGKVSTRVWDISQLPEIGKKYGFLKRPTNEQLVICKYMQKGGVAKTTTTYNDARIMALNGIKVIIIGLDPELSITDISLPHREVLRLDELENQKGLYHFFADKVDINSIIKPTSIPTLDIIPETHELVLLDKWLSQEKRREYVFQDRLMPLLSEYDVVMFDNSPTWNHLVENSLVVSGHVSMPLGCNLLAYNASATNMENVYDFQSVMNLSEQNIVMFSTLLDRNSLSQQINATYLQAYFEDIISTPIRRSVKFEEALMSKQSILEYAPSSVPAEEYYHFILEEWYRINNSNPLSVAEMPFAELAEV